LNRQIENWHEATLDIFFRNLPEKRSSRWGETITAEKMLECRWVKPKLVCQVVMERSQTADQGKNLETAVERPPRRA
jgi:hypothetical protein